MSWMLIFWILRRFLEKMSTRLVLTIPAWCRWSETQVFQRWFFIETGLLVKRIVSLVKENQSLRATFVHGFVVNGHRVAILCVCKFLGTIRCIFAVRLSHRGKICNESQRVWFIVLAALLKLNLTINLNHLTKETRHLEPYFLSNLWQSVPVNYEKPILKITRCVVKATKKQSTFFETSYQCTLTSNSQVRIFLRIVTMR